MSSPRNKPCPCGSQRKFKNCCWEAVQTKPLPLELHDQTVIAARAAARRQVARADRCENIREEKAGAFIEVVVA